jgi:hypothetical protein
MPEDIALAPPSDRRPEPGAILRISRQQFLCDDAANAGDLRASDRRPKTEGDADLASAASGAVEITVPIALTLSRGGYDYNPF